LGAGWDWAAVAASRYAVNQKRAETFFAACPAALRSRVLLRKLSLAAIPGGEKALVRAGAPAKLLKLYLRAVKLKKCAPRIRVRRLPKQRAKKAAA
jgi:hypothetical protein